ncbi:MAG: hypothetical protein ABI131_02465 [Nostocoides sp.]
MSDPAAAETLLQRFHEEIRLRQREDEPSPGIVQDADGPVFRRYPTEPGTSYCMVESPSGLGVDPDHWIARQVEFFAGRGEQGERFEWKTYGYDQPSDLRERLTRAGLTAEEDEVLLLGEVDRLIHDVDLPDGVRMRAVDAADDAAYRKIHDLMTLVWEGSEAAASIDEAHYATSMTGSLQREKAANPDAVDIAVIEEVGGQGTVVCAAWVRYSPGTDFASMWGGSTRPDWRRRGLYRTTVSYRARLARDRGYSLMRVDTSPDSRPILLSLGLRSAATTTPFNWNPPNCDIR